jgi:hypothetical protein
MEINKLTYAFLLAGSVAVPFALSFDRKVAFYKYWKSLTPATMITAAIFHRMGYFLCTT